MSHTRVHLFTNGHFCEPRQIQRVVDRMTAGGWTPAITLPDDAGHLLTRPIAALARPLNAGAYEEELIEAGRSTDRIHILGLACAETLLNSGLSLQQPVVVDLTGLTFLSTGSRMGKGLPLGQRLNRFLERIRHRDSWIIIAPDTPWLGSLFARPANLVAVRDEVGTVRDAKAAPRDKDRVVILMPTPLSNRLGVETFASLAREVTNLGLDCHFALSGRSDLDDPDHVPVGQIKGWEDQGILEWWDRTPLHVAIGRSDILVFPSHGPVHFRALSHALALAKPVIATTVVGFEDYVEENVNGFLVPPGNTRAFSEAIVPLILDPDRRARMGRASQALFDGPRPPGITQRYEDVLSHIYTRAD